MCISVVNLWFVWFWHNVNFCFLTIFITQVLLLEILGHCSWYFCWSLCFLPLLILTVSWMRNCFPDWRKTFGDVHSFSYSNIHTIDAGNLKTYPIRSHIISFLHNWYLTYIILMPNTKYKILVLRIIPDLGMSELFPT